MQLITRNYLLVDFILGLIQTGSANAHVGAGSNTGGTDHDTARSWSRWAIARWWLLISPCGTFKFKIDRLNSKTSHF
jgi:hypothetical protein